MKTKRYLVLMAQKPDSQWRWLQKKKPKGVVSKERTKESKQDEQGCKRTSSRNHQTFALVVRQCFLVVSQLSSISIIGQENFGPGSILHCGKGLFCLCGGVIDSLLQLHNPAFFLQVLESIHIADLDYVLDVVLLSQENRKLSSHFKQRRKPKPHEQTNWNGEVHTKQQTERDNSFFFPDK